MMHTKVNLNDTSLGSKEFIESQRLFSLAFVSMLDKMGPDHTRGQLEDVFEEATFSLFPEVLTVKNLERTIMNLKSEDVKFK